MPFFHVPISNATKISYIFCVITRIYKKVWLVRFHCLVVSKLRVLNNSHRSQVQYHKNAFNMYQKYRQLDSCYPCLQLVCGPLILVVPLWHFQNLLLLLHSQHARNELSYYDQLNYVLTVHIALCFQCFVIGIKRYWNIVYIITR